MSCLLPHGRTRNIAVVVAIVVMAVLAAVAILTPILVVAVQQEDGVLVGATYGDSITDVGSYGNVMDKNQLFPFGYQATMYRELKQMGIQSKIYNYGIGGQYAQQIVDRLPASVPAHYITILAGINDVNNADYASSVNATQILADSIVQSMTDGVNGVLSQRPPETKIVIGTVPPFCARGLWGQLEAKRDAIVYINERLRSLVATWNSTRVLLADVFADMAQDDGWRLEACCPQDRLHFTPQADIICGQAFSRAMRRDWLSKT
jgi:lysophospholipase L1-like esterase